MPRRTPKGRTTHMSLYSPGGETPSVCTDGTWIEAEAFAYPNDTFTRRAWVRMPDGSSRVVRCAVADTFFTVPARVTVAGKTVQGFVTSRRPDENSDDLGLIFEPCA